MTVQDLIDELEMKDPDAKVYLMCQPNYPFEHRIGDCVERRDFQEDFDDPDDPDAPETPPTGDRWQSSTSSLPANDVFLLDGGQVRYGSKRAFE